MRKGFGALAVAGALGLGTVHADGPAVSGYVDFGYNYNLNGLKANTYRAFDTQANTFTLNNAEVVLSGMGPSDVNYRIDLNYGKDASVVSATDGTGNDQFNVQQAFLSFPCPLTNGTVTAGKFVTPFGAEVIESKDNMNISRGFLFTYAIPLVHTGVKYDKSFGEGFSVAGGVVNGWDKSDDTNKGKSFFAQTSLNVLPKVSITVGGMYGPEIASPAYSTATASSTEKFSRSLVDAIVKYTPTGKLTLVANVDYGVEEGVAFESTASDDKTANWAGIALYADYAFTDSVSGALRYENFDDEGSRMTSGPEIHQTVNSYTATLQKKWNGLTGRLEYRMDSSTDKVFTKDDGSLDDTQSTIGVNLTYSF